MSEAPLATGVPVPIANPTSAFVKAGASLVPSPVTATTPSLSYTPVTKRYLSDGDERARTLSFLIISLNFCMSLTASIYLSPTVRVFNPPTASLKSFPVIAVYAELSSSSYVTIPASREIALAVSRLSPVHMMTLIPALLQVLIESYTESLNGS
jgi:hypothetical protein